MQNQDLQDSNNPNDESENTEPQGADNFGFGKLIFLGLISVVLYAFGPLSIFAPVPLAMAVLLYGRVRTAFLAVAMAFIVFAFSFKASNSSYLGFLYILTYGFSALVAEIILRDINPVKGLYKAGGILLITILLGLGVYSAVSELGIEQELYKIVGEQFTTFKTQNAEYLKAGGVEAKVLSDLLENPKEMVDEILNWTPSLIFVFTFGGLWICLGVVLKNALVWKGKLNYTYQLKDLFNFRVPDFFVWPLIVGLALTLGSEYIHPRANIYGGNVLYCLGIFYFFQGFGILTDFLTNLKIVGFIRTILIILTVVTGLKVLVLIGVFDMWFNFRKFFKKKLEKNEEGDK